MRTSYKNFGKDLLVETIAVFVGISLALVIDNVKDEHQFAKENHNYFGLLRAELEQDTSFISSIKEEMERQHIGLDSLIQNPELLHLTKYVEETPVYEPPIELLNSTLSSDAFSSIYDSVLFNLMSHTLRDFRLYNDMQLRIDKEQQGFVQDYLYPNINPDSGKIEKNDLGSDWSFRNKLTHLNEMHKARYVILISIQISYAKLITRISDMID